MAWGGVVGRGVGGGARGGGDRVDIELIPFVVQHKLTQRCKAIMLL